MLLWATRYLAVVLVIGVAFGLIQSRDLFRPRAEKTARNDAPASSGPAFNEHVVRAGSRGHFVLEAVVNGEVIDFLVDTGATDLVLSRRDAERVGFEAYRLDFSRRYQTANGEIRAAPVMLREVRIGQHRLFDVDGSVSAAALPVSVLGVSVLNRLGGYRVEGDRLHLYW